MNRKNRKHTFQSGQQAEVNAYRMAESRCVNSKDPCWKDFGGKAVEFRFKSFREFWAEVGPRPVERSGKLSAYSLTRINTSGHFEPGNVQWARRGTSRRRGSVARATSRGTYVNGTVSKFWQTSPAYRESVVTDYVASHMDLSYVEVGKAIGCSGERVFQIMYRLGARRARGRKRATPVPGTHFGKWTVISTDRQLGKWLCQCDCGTERWVRSNNLKSGGSTNCGCVPAKPKN